MEQAYVPMARWGRDHWRCLVYVEAVMVEMAGFQVGADPRMTANRRHYRVLAEQCPRPKRPSHPVRPGMVMRPEHATTLADGTQPDPWHDDWSCVQDFAAEGLFTVGPEQVEPGSTLTFSDEGLALTAKLRQHKAAGGQYRDFACETGRPAAVAGGDL